MVNNWILIGLQAILTYLSRIIGIEIMTARSISPGLRLYFNYVPVGIIAALIAKQVFIYTDGGPSVSIPVLAGCLATVIASGTIKSFLPTVAIGVIAGWLTRHILS